MSSDHFYPSSNGFIAKEVFVIVAGLSTGQHIAPLLRAHGYSVIHVQPKSAEAVGVMPIASDYIASFSEDDNLLENLSQFKIRAIIPGCENGVLLADSLDAHFNLATKNDISKSICRTNKYWMQETIRQAGIRAANQTMVNDLESLLLWVQSNGYPVVLKPEESAGTDGVFICEAEEQLIDAFKTIMSTKNIYGVENKYVVAQEMLIGDEFMINTISSGDDMIVTEIYFSKKKVLNNSPLYDYIYIIDVKDPLFEQLATYVKQVLPALGFRHGAANTEVIVTPKGPTLVEVNCRLMGAFDMSAITEATGSNQVNELVN